MIAAVVLVGLAAVGHAQAQPAPAATMALPAQATIGESFSFPVTFDNTGAATGYGPFIDLLFPSTGIDGAGPEADDGITFVSASYLGQPVASATVITLDASGRALHPLAVNTDGTPVVITGTPGDQFVVLELPFGSVTPTQPSATVQVTAAVSNLADLGAPLQIVTRGGFRFGVDAVTNPATDPSILGTVSTSSVTPVLWRLTKTYLGPEDETVSGPNFPRQYRIDVDVAAGQTITDLDVTDVLPGNLQFVSVDATSAPAAAIATPSTSTPGGTLTRRFASVTGTASAADASMTFTFYATGLDAGSSPVINPNTGDDVSAVDDAQSAAAWTPIDTRDPATPVTNDATPNDHTLTIKAIETQKAVAVVVDGGTPGPTPGDTLEYTVDIQVSDFFAVQGLVVTDLISDAQREDHLFVPTLAIVEHGGGTSPAAVMSPLSFSFDINPLTGRTTATFLIGLEQRLRGLDGRLLGGCVPPPGTLGPFPTCVFNGGPTTLRLVYRTTIQDRFTAPLPGTDPNVSHGDTLSNGVTVSADLLSTTDAATLTGSSEDDESGTTVTIPSGTFTKAVYAINGSTAVPAPALLGPGDTVTYRLRYTLPSSTDIDALTITDFLPLPILVAGEVTGPFATTADAAPPPAGSAKFGPADTSFAVTGQAPTISTDAAANSVIFAYPTFDDPGNTPSELDILFTVTVTDDPFADGLILTNLAEVRERTTTGDELVGDAIGQITLNEPNLTVKKGVVATDRIDAVFVPATIGPVAFTPPGSAGPRFTGTIDSTGLAATPIDSNLGEVDANDLVSFAIVVENLGSGPDGAFDVVVRDTLSSLMTIPAGGLNLTVTNGAGVPIPFADLGGGLFGGGIQLTDPGATGVLTSFDPGSGTNIAVITYDLQLQPTVVSDQVITNTATLSNYAGVEGGPDFTTVDLTDEASVRTSTTALVAKVLVSTSQAHTAGTNLAIGELGTVRVTIVVPQGVTLPMTLTDTLDPGLALVSLDSITASPALTASAGTFPAILAAATIENVGGGAVNDARRFILDFGQITNTDPDDNTAETIHIDYTVVVLNAPGNDRGATRTNQVVLDFTNGTSNLAPGRVTLVEPTLDVAKTGSTPSGDQGDTVTFTVSLQHHPASNADAFEISLTDVVPPGLTFVSAAHTSGLVPATLTPGAGFVATWTTFPRGSVSTFTVVATIDNGLSTGAVLTNTASVTYSSLPGAVTTPQSPLNTFSTERTGNPADPGGAENDYIDSAGASVQVSLAEITKMVTTTNQPHTSGNSVAIGEIVTYEVTVGLPEAVSAGVTLVDTLDPGLAFVGFDSLVVSNLLAVTTSVPGGFPAVLSGAVVSNPTASPNTAGSRVTFDFGTITNTNAINGLTETITLTYRAVVLNLPGVIRGHSGNNSVTWTAGGIPLTAAAANVVVVEPALQTTKAAAPTTGDPGDAVTFTLLVANAGASNADAQDVALADVIPAGLTLTSGPTATAGVPPSTLALTAGTINATWTSLPLGGTSTITFTATLDAALTPGVVVNNTAALTWTSLPGAIGAPQSTFNGFSVERTGNTGDVGGAANTYATTAAAAVTLNSSSLAGQVFVDVNGDGAFGAGDVALSSVLMTLSGIDHLGNTVLLSTSTLTDGTYVFTPLRAGTYTIREAQPFIYVDGPDFAGSVGGVVGNDVVADIALPTGASTVATGYNFTERPSADLEIAKTDTPDPVAPGGALTYTMVVRNNGPNDAVNVVVRDPIPTGTTFVAVSAPGMTCTTPPVGATGDVECTAPALAVSASLTITLTLQVDATALNGAVITNAAAVRSDTIDTRPDNNRDAEPTTVVIGTAADVSIAKTDAVDPVIVGDDVTYTLTVSNHGPVPATNVTVTDTLPGSLTLVSATPSQGGPCGGTPISCNLGTLASGAQATVTIVATTTTPGVVLNPAVVAAAEPDPTPSNNLAAEPTTIADPGSADLAVTKVDAVDPVFTDAVIVYAITVENRGPAPAASVTLADTVPAGTVFEFVSAPPGWTCTTPAVGAAGAISCSTATLVVGATATLTLGVRLVPGTAPGTTVSNTATAAATTPDPDAANNTDTEPTLVVGVDAADVAIVKTDAPDPQAAGATVSYGFTVTNNGAVTATNVTVTDPLPPGTAFVAGSPGCGEAGGVVTCSVGTLAPGASTVVGITITTPPVAGTIDDIASVAAAETDLVPANNSEPEQTTLVAVADVQIAKTGPASAVAGSVVEYTLTVTNNGPSQAENVTVIDPAPSGLTFVSNAGACTTAFPCLLGAMLPGESRVITTSFQVPSGYTTPNPIVNTATVATTTSGDALANNQASASTPIAFSSDIEVLKAPSVRLPGLGGPFDYIITARNLGPSDATNVLVTDVLPPEVTYLSQSASSGAYNPATGTWTIPALTAGAAGATLTLTVRAEQATIIRNTATRTGGDQPDPNPANDQDEALVIVLGQTDVEIVKAGPAVALSGSTVTYTLTIRNHGPSVAADVVVDDPVPANLTFVSNAGACVTAFPCPLDTMLIGEIRTISSTYTVGIVPNNTIVTNVATVDTASIEVAQSNNTASADTRILTFADVGLFKRVAPDQARIGEDVTWTIRATNFGPNPATGVVVTDLLPDGLTFRSASPSQGVYGTLTGAWTIGDLAVGQTETLTLVATVDVAGPITNIAVKTGQVEPDPNRSNDAAAAVVNSGPYADIGVTKSADPMTPAQGAALTFTIVATNFGPYTAPTVSVDDVLPGGVTFVSATPSTGTFDPASGRWTIGEMLSGASATLTLETVVDRPGPLLNRVRVTNVGVLDPNPTNDRDAVLLHAVLELNVRVAKVALRPTVVPFENVPFLIVVTNDGPSPASGVAVTDVLPPGLRFVGARASQGSYDPAGGVWTVGDLAPSGRAVLALVAQAMSAGSAVNTATIAAVDQPDLNPEDNTDSATVVSPQTTGGTCTDVELLQQFSPSTEPGGTIRYVFTAVNRGPAYARDVVISGIVPDGYGAPDATFESMTPSPGGTCAVTGQNMFACTWSGPTLVGDGAARSAEIVLRLSPTAPNGAIVWGWFKVESPDDCNHSNDIVDNYVFVDEGIGPTVDLEIRSAIVTPTGLSPAISVAVGAPVDVWFAVTNHGAVPSSGDYALVLSDDQALVADEPTLTAGTFNGGWQTGPIAPGATIYAHFRVRMLRSTSARVQLIRVRGGFPDPDASNDHVELIIDGIAPSPGGGRWVASGNVDGVPGEEIVTGAAVGDRPQVRVFSGAGTDTGVRFWAFEPAFLGGVRVASCDVNGDGSDEIVVGQGPGGSLVRVLRVVGGAVIEVAGFEPFESDFRGGVSVACADLHGDGRGEVIVGAGPGRPADVRVFEVGAVSAVSLASWTAYEAGFTGGVRVAAATHLGGAIVPSFSVVTTPGPGVPVLARAWSVVGDTATLVAGAFTHALSYTGGAVPTLGDIDGDGVLDLAITPDDAAAGGLLRVLSLATGQWILDVPFGFAGINFNLRADTGTMMGGPGRPELLITGGPGGPTTIWSFLITPNAAIPRVAVPAIEIP